MKRSLILIALSFLALAQLSWGQTVPQTISYQGVLRDKTTGDIVANDDYDILFTLYDNAGTAVWSEWHSVGPLNNPVTVTDGVFSVILGKATPFTGILAPPVELGIRVVPDPEMTPRIELTSVIYALHAGRSDSSDYAQKAGEVSGTYNIFPSDGNVGIGTASPQYALQVITGSGRAVHGYAQLSAGTNYGIYGQTNSNDGYAGYFVGGRNYFSGNVGIGTTSPGTPLHIMGTTAGGAAQRDDFLTLHQKTTVGQMVDGLGVGMTFMVEDVDNVANEIAVIYVTRDGADNGGKIQLRTREAGILKQGITIRASGNVGIGTINPGSYKLYVNGNFYVNGSAYCTNGVWSGSDRRWKRNIAPLEGSLSKVLQLRGVTFDWRRDEFTDMDFDEGTQVGFIAQEVEAVIPELVNTGEDGYKAVAYDKLTAVLIEAVKELKAEKDALERRVAALETALHKRQLGSVTTAAAGQ